MQLATLAKNHILSIFNPRSSLSPVSQMKGPEGSKGARVMWLEDLVIAVSGFDRYDNSIMGLGKQVRHFDGAYLLDHLIDNTDIHG